MRLGHGIGLTYPQRVGGGSSYTGPLDLVPGAVVAYSVARALSAAWIGQNVIRLLRDSDDAELDFVAGADGSVSVAAVTAWLAGANGFVVTLYDQSGNGRDATLDEDFLAWVPSSQGGRPAMSGNNFYLSASTFSVLGGEFTGFVIGKGECRIASQDDGAGTGGAFQLISGGSATIYAESDSSSKTAGAFYTLDGNTYFILDGKVAFGTVNVKANGTTLTPDSSRDFGGALGTIIDQTALFGGGTESQEGFYYAGLKSDADRLAIRQNSATYYGITLP